MTPRNSANDTPGQKRRRGRPLSDPERGPATVAERAAARRKRVRDEMEALAQCLQETMRDLRGHGALSALGWMFWHTREPALAAIRRHDPDRADRFQAISDAARDLVNEFARRWHGKQPPPGRRKGSIVVAGAEFSVEPSGTVTRNGRSTGLRINMEYNCAVLVEPKDISFHPRRHYGGQGGKEMALFDAALIIACRLPAPAKLPPDWEEVERARRFAPERFSQEVLERAPPKPRSGR